MSEEKSYITNEQNNATESAKTTMSEKTIYNTNDEYDSSEGMGAILWMMASLAVIVLTAFSIILVRSLLILSKSKDPFHVLLGSGIVAMFFFHVIINIGMAIGIMPITGIPLFFLSYGGSSLWTGLIAIGFLETIYIKRFTI